MLHACTMFIGRQSKLTCHVLPLDGYFNVVYMGKESSKYRDEVSFQSVSQVVVVSRCLSDTDAMYEVQCSLAENENYRLIISQ